MKNIEYSLLGLILLGSSWSCTFESCKIDYKDNPSKYNQAVKEILELGLEMDNDDEYHRVLMTIRIKDSIVNSSLFNEIEFVEIHEDSTIIFQAPNCTQGSALRDVNYILAFSPKGKEHVSRKRNTSCLEKMGENWYYGKHIITLAN